MTAWREAWRAGLWGRTHWARNLLSGLVVGVVALPLAMAFAIASGARPEQGLYTAIVAGLLATLFGGSRLQISGPTGAFVVILAGITAEHGIAGLQVATLMAGIILLLFGLARMGAILRFIPEPVITGFTVGIAVVIWIGQWREFFGLPALPPGHFHQQLWDLFEALPGLHPATTLLALLGLAIVIANPFLPLLRKIPGPLVALVVVTALQAGFHFEGVRTIGSAFGGIPSGLPLPDLPALSLEQCLKLLGPAFTIAMLGAIESLLSAVIADGMSGTRHDSNQELVGQGIANLAAPLFGGFAATGALARTATNIRYGATSPLSGVVHAVFLVGVLLFLAPLAAHVPLAVLAAILFVVAWNMADLRHLRRSLRRAPRADLVILLVTFGLTLFADLVVAVNIGVILATLHFLRRMAHSVEVRPATARELEAEAHSVGLDALPADLRVLRMEGPFFFAAVEHLERALDITRGEAPATLILHLGWVPFVDLTGLATLEEAIRSLKGRGIRVLLAGANPRVQRKLRRAGIERLLGEDGRYEKLADALKAALTKA